MSLYKRLASKKHLKSWGREGGNPPETRAEAETQTLKNTLKSCRRSINRIGYKRARTSTQLSVYIAAYQCCKGKRKGQVHYYQKKVNANLIWIRHEHPVTFPLNSAECTIRWFIPVVFFFFFSFFLMLAMQTHRGKKQKQQIQLDLIPRYAPAQLFIIFFFYLRIILTPLKQDRAFGPFQHLGLRGRSILAP